MGSSIDLDVRKIPHTPMKVILNGDKLYGCFWYGDNFYKTEQFTDKMWDIYNKNAEKINAHTVG
jgi:hypothetical protein